MRTKLKLSLGKRRSMYILLGIAFVSGLSCRGLTSEQLFAVQSFMAKHPSVSDHCAEVSGKWTGRWTEYHDGIPYTGAWKGQITPQCHFVCTDETEVVYGLVNPETGELRAVGDTRQGLGRMFVFGRVRIDGMRGRYYYSRGGHGTFWGRAKVSLQHVKRAPKLPSPLVRRYTQR